MLRLGIIAFALGICALHGLRDLPDSRLVWLVPGIVVLYWRYGARLKWYGRLLTWALVGMLWALWHAHGAVSQRLDPRWVGQDILVEGCIANLPEYRAGLVRFEFDIANRTDNPLSLPAKVRLTWRTAEKLVPGERWRFTVRLKPPRRFYTPGSFDYEAWLLQRRIGATGYISTKATSQYLGITNHRYWVQRLRYRLSQRLAHAMADRPYQKVIQALAVGNTSGLDETDWQRLRLTGTNHLLAISGLHISLIAGLVYLLARWLWARSTRLSSVLAAPRAAGLAAFCVAVMYALLAGFSIPTQRAVIMLAVVLGSLFWLRQTAPSHTLAVALLAVLLWDPLAVLAIGFWLSFTAVAIILYVIAWRPPAQIAKWRLAVKLQIALGVGLIPILATVFAQVSLVAPIANVLAVPLVSFIIVPLALIGSVLVLVSVELAGWVLAVCDRVIAGLWWGLDAIAGLPWAAISLPVVTAWALIWAALGLAILGLPRGLPVRWLGLFCLAPLVFPTFERPPLGAVRFTVLDVGQGLAAVVETHNHVLLFDAGPRYSNRFDAGQAIVVPFLRRRGWSAISRVVISHGDLDHVGGFASIKRQLHVAEVFSSVPKRIPLQHDVQRCQAGQGWQWDGISFEFLHPSPLQRDTSGNNGSCVLRVQVGDQQILLTGDIEMHAEKQLLRQYADRLAATILVVPHHGSKTSSSEAFIRQVMPQYAVFAVGEYNRYGFPRHEVVARYQNYGIQLLDTATHGAIEFTLQPGQDLTKPIRHRDTGKRYWNKP